MRPTIGSGLLATAAICAIALATACSRTNVDPVAERQWQTENGLLRAVVFEGEDRGGRTVADRLREYGVPGLSFALINDGAIEWTGAYGLLEVGGAQPVTSATRFQAASLAKPVTAAAAMRMRDAGLLALDADIQGYLTSFTIPAGAQARDNPVTFRNLLSHTAGVTPGGYVGYAPGESLPSDIQVLRGAAPANSRPALIQDAPGTAVRYSGGGYTIVELALQDITGLPFERAMDEWILSAAAMAHSTYVQPLPADLESEAARGHQADGSVVPGGWHVHPEQAAAGLWSTPSDLATFAIALREAYQGRAALMPQATAVEMLTPVLGDEGIGLIVRGNGDSLTFSHAGGNVGYRAFLILHVGSGDGAVFMANSDRGMEIGFEMLRAASAVYRWPDFKPQVMKREPLDRAALTAFTGTYEFGRGLRIVVTLPDSTEQIDVTFPNGDRYVLVAVGPSAFVHPETGVTLDFAGPDSARTVTLYGDVGRRVRP